MESLEKLIIVTIGKKIEGIEFLATASKTHDSFIYKHFGHVYI